MVPKADGGRSPVAEVVLDGDGHREVPVLERRGRDIARRDPSRREPGTAPEVAIRSRTAGHDRRQLHRAVPQRAGDLDPHRYRRSPGHLEVELGGGRVSAGIGNVDPDEIDGVGDRSEEERGLGGVDRRDRRGQRAIDRPAEGERWGVARHGRDVRARLPQRELGRATEIDRRRGGAALRGRRTFGKQQEGHPEEPSEEHHRGRAGPARPRHRRCRSYRTHLPTPSERRPARPGVTVLLIYNLFP